MNSLSLRVSSVKTGDNVRKNAEMRAALVTLPKQYELFEDTYCLEMKRAKTVPEQVLCVKNTFKNLGTDEKALQFLCDIYFSSPLKHPVRNQILKLLITAAKLGTGDLDESSIVKALVNSLHRLVEEGKTHTESSNWNLTIASLSGCFENFECGLKALEQCINIVFPYACSSVNRYVTELGVLSSPSVRNEYYMYVHNSLRFLLNCVQEFGKVMKTSHTDQIKQLNTNCKEIILDTDIPMDPRTNAGILMAYIAKLFEEYDTFVAYVKDIKNPNEIAMCVGIINTCDQHDFQQYSADIRDICGKIDEIANANATVPNILLCATRALYQISKLTYNYALKSPQTLDDIKLILRKLLIFTVAYLEHHMDSVRHICRDLMRNIVACSKKVQFDFLLQKIYDACNSDRLSLSMKCVVLQQAASILGADEIISNCLDLFSHLFATHLGRDFIVNNLFETLMISHHKEQPFENWVKLWINYLLNIAAMQDARLPDIEILIVKAVKCDCRVVQTIISCEDKPKIPISTKLSALWAVRKSGIKIDNFQEMMQQFSKNLQLSILSNEDDTRIMALRLLVETHKTTEPLTLLECKHLLTYLEYNTNCQSPATRQKSLGLLSKGLVRCELNLVKLLKGKQPPKLVQNQPLELKFLQDFMRILVENLFEGANFSRRSVSLQLLNQCLTIGINCNLKLLTLLPKTTVTALVNTLADPYESNKELAVTMLKLLEDNSELSLIEQYNLNINLLELQTMLTSVKPTESVTASYQLEFLCNKCSPAIFGDYDLPNYATCMYAAIKWLLAELKQGLKMAKQSILEAAKLNPLYGLLLAIKHLLKRLDFAYLSQEITWRILIAELIVICKDLTNVVAPIVNSSSPEGHLPNDFSDLPQELQTKQPSPEKKSSSPCKILSSKLRKIDMASVKTTPQMVLLCAWRTVKEVSLILGEIVICSPIQFNKLTEHFLITKEQILEIGEHFKLLLSETKHRGAFEQAYVGFSKLCCRLWTVEANDLNSLPMIWLRDLINLISKDELFNEKICATRRSAGVPFMVQALITSELQVGTTKSLYYCMTHLLQLCSASDKTSESRTHALNILRALFRCTDLNEAVGEFVSEGVMAAIRGYDANNWSEKNSSTLLFASLITRIFGVQRTKDSENLNIRNKMTGRVFFLRYPKLYDFFLEQLQKASDLIQQQQKAHKLHPLLLILSRLYPSALEGTESNLKLSEFIPYISKCGGCPEMQTRFLAAKAIVALISKDEVVTMILNKCAEMVLMADGVYEFKSNTLHGNLLQILYLVKYHKILLNDDLIADITCSIVSVHERTKLKNAVILKVMLDIYIEILNSLTTLNFGPAVVQQLLYFSTLTILCDPNMAFYYPVLYKSNFLYNLHIMRLTLPYGALSDYTLSPPLTNMPLEQAETCLNIMLLLLLKAKTFNETNTAASSADNAATAVATTLDEETVVKLLPQDYENNEILQELEIMPHEYQFVRILSDDTMNELATELKESKALQLTLKEVVKLPLYYPEATMKSYAVMSLLSNFDFTLTNLLKESKKHPGDVKSPMMLCVERIVQNQGVEYKCAQLCLEYLTEISQPWQPDCLRFKAANLLVYIAVHYPKSLEKKRINFVRSYIRLMLNLLMDDDYDIRDFTAKIVLHSLPDDIELGLSDSLSNNDLVSCLNIPIRTESVVSTMAQRLFLQYTADLLLNYRMDDTYILDIFKLITSCLTTQCLAKDDDDQHSSSSSSGGGGSGGGGGGGSSIGSCSSSTDVEIFEKNEANVYAEPLKAITDTVVVFKCTFRLRPKVVRFVESYLQDLTNQGSVLFPLS
ncbi:thyroid adenoma-associated protein homolog isoform X4 [Lucilia cuprina]|uniref:thyroid adenoma-associated protein homolog isoform X4 n=1 Tax=Lucilia cuprina TaxID=7375 RepID=UPI001F0707D7|nr:thyroid adenoma-associated protein homolog isoform X4 [Lucilia cuprina]